MTVQFLIETRSILNEQGVIVANTFSTSRLYDHESVTYETVFGPFFNFKMPMTGNRVIIASTGELPGKKVIQDRANKLSGRFTRYSVNIDDFPRYMKLLRDWNQDSRPLTDQFAPANILSGN